MARPKRPPALIEATPEISETATAQMVALQNEADQRIADVLSKFGDGLPFDAARYEYAIRGHLSRSAEEMLAAGRALIVVREHLPHGEWGEFLGRLGLERSIAARMAQAAIKFSNVATSQHLLKAAASKSKLFELMVLDDEQIEALNSGDTVAGLKLDEIACMPVSDLRRKVRDLQAEYKTAQKLLDDKNRDLDYTRAKLERRENAEPDEAYQELRKDVGFKANAIEHALRQQLHPAIAKLAEHDHLHGGDSKPLSAGLVMQLQQVLNELRDEFALPAFQNFVPSFLEGVELPAVDPDAPLAEGDVELSMFAVEPPEGVVS